MKKLIVFFVIFNSFFGQAQNEKFRSGNYTAIGSQKGIHLKLNEDNSYEFIFSNGNFEIKNDTIYFHNRFADNYVFQIEPIYEKNDDSKLIFN